MGVIVGRFPGKVKEGFFEQGRRKLSETVKGFVNLAENFGLVACNMGTDFWKNGK